ncbi:hypothetical protein cyc_07583 [Cyclospora cayetanensis]|uniref:Uncharacterized protein n=1 Tax=Cyclospora cayetanensis TaxID=88456 RepID=A0A1D3CV58_9EIME|nr:hypothetical protein cyc_07583 [Cyclospora cayetanensis]
MQEDRRELNTTGKSRFKKLLELLAMPCADDFLLVQIALVWELLNVDRVEARGLTEETYKNTTVVNLCRLCGVNVQ